MRKFVLVLALALPLSLPVSGQGVHAPNNEETRFLEFLNSIYDLGEHWSKAGYSRQADFFYGQAAAAVTSWRTAITEIAEDVKGSAAKKAADDAKDYALGREDEANDILSDLFGTSVSYSSLLGRIEKFTEAAEKVEGKMENLEEIVEEKARDWGMEVFKADEQEWHATRSQCIASPYPDYFKGMVCEYRGDADGARKYYARALQNPYFPGIVFDFSYLARLDYRQLVELSNWLKSYQVKYEGAITDKGFHFEEDSPAWDADALARKAADCLSMETPDISKAQDYMEAAMHADPFSIKYVYMGAMLYTELGDGVSAARCLNEALKMDPDN